MFVGLLWIAERSSKSIVPTNDRRTDMRDEHRALVARRANIYVTLISTYPKMTHYLKFLQKNTVRKVYIVEAFEIFIGKNVINL